MIGSRGLELGSELIIYFAKIAALRTGSRVVETGGQVRADGGLHQGSSSRMERCGQVEEVFWTRN